MYNSGMDAYAGRRALVDLPLTRTCPTCKRPPGHECITKSGYRPLAYHKPRKLLVASHASDQGIAALIMLAETMISQTVQGSYWEYRKFWYKEIQEFVRQEANEPITGRR